MILDFLASLKVVVVIINLLTARESETIDDMYKKIYQTLYV